MIKGIHHISMKCGRAEDCEMLCIPELPDDYDFEKTYTAVIDWCQKAFTRIK